MRIFFLLCIAALLSACGKHEPSASEIQAKFEFLNQERGTARSNALFKHVGGRIHNPRIDIAFDFQIKQISSWSRRRLR